MLVLSILIGLLYFAGITSNGLRGFVHAWQFNPRQEYYVLLPYSGNAAQLTSDSRKIEEFLKDSPLIDGFRKIDEQSFKQMFNQQNSVSKAWIESIPFPVFLELNLKSTVQESIEQLEKHIKAIANDAQIYTQPRYSTDFITSFKALIYIIDSVIVCLITVFLAVLILMTRSLFALQEQNIERLSLLGATPNYIKKLYGWFMVRCITLSSFYGFLGACMVGWGVFIATEQISFFPYGFAMPSLLLYLLLPVSCLIVGVSITYVLITNLLKKLWTCV